MTYLDAERELAAAGSAATSRRSAITIDASGGWWDAGDYLKFVHATSYTDALLLTGVRDFPAQMGAARRGRLHGRGEVRRRLAAADVGRPDADALLPGGDRRRATARPSATTTSGGCPRPTTRSAAPIRSTATSATGRSSGPARPARSISPNLAGRDAAALAARLPGLPDERPGVREQVPRRRGSTSSTSPTRTRGQLTTAIPFSFYPETEWRDDLELGAVELHLARSPPAARHRPGCHTPTRRSTSAAAALGQRLHHRPERRRRHAQPLRRQRARPLRASPGDAAAGNPAGLATTQAALLADMKKALDGALAQGATDPFEFGFPWDVWDTTTHGAGLSVMASEYDQLTGTTTYAAAGRPLAGERPRRERLGPLADRRRPASTFPNCIQHQVANIVGLARRHAAGPRRRRGRGPQRRGYDGLAVRMRACPPNGVDAYAAFNGKTAQFKDNVQSYSNTEPAIDLTATSPLAFARQAAGIR